MRVTFLFWSAMVLMIVGACSDDGGKPAADMVVADTEVADTAAPDTQVPDLALPDTMPQYDFTVPTCPFEVNLASKVPCKCGSTLVYDLAVQYPDCTSPKAVKCCPLDGAPKCE